MSEPKTEPVERTTKPLTFRHFSLINRMRCESPSGFNQELDDWSLSDWVTALTGEVGEMANIAKKMNRVHDGIPGNKETPLELRDKLKDELADIFCYLDQQIQSQGFQLEEKDGVTMISRQCVVGQLTKTASTDTCREWREKPAKQG